MSRRKQGLGRGDTRVAYGARCFWWGDIHDVGTTGGSMTISGEEQEIRLPCCPACGGMLLEAPTEAAFLEGAQLHEANGHPGYVAFIKWSKGRCFPDLVSAELAYANRQKVH